LYVNGSKPEKAVELFADLREFEDALTFSKLVGGSLDYDIYFV
jgi:hypothetical protein